MFRALFLSLIVALVGYSSPSQAPNVSLINHEGKRFNLQDLKGNFVLLSFIFTRCPMPKMCPLTMSLSKQVIVKWKEKKTYPPLRILAVTLDPQFDTPAVLKKYGEAHRVDFKNFILATASEKVINEFASSFNVIGVPGASGMSHNIKTILLDPEMREITQYKENEWQAEAVLNEIQKYLVVPEKVPLSPASPST